MRSISRVLEPEQALAAGAPEDLRFISSRSYGGPCLLDQLWRRLGIDLAITGALATRRYPQEYRARLFALTANRALQPSSKLAACALAAERVALPGVEVFTEDDAYRAMDAPLECEDDISERVYTSVATLLNLEVDLIFFDTTSTYFETEDEDQGDEGLRRYGHSKDARDDLP